MNTGWLTSAVLSLSVGPPLRAVFSDLDGTLVHYQKSFELHGCRIVRSDSTSAVVASPAGEERRCRVVRSSTLGIGLVSERTCDLVDALRAEGVLFVVVTAARKSSLLERWPLLPACDVRVCESGSRIYIEDTLEREFASRFEHITGPLERELDPEARPELLWAWYRYLGQRLPTELKRDARSYYGMFRVDTRGHLERHVPSQHEAALAALITSEMPPELSSASNLGMVDFFPSASGKGNAVSYLQHRFGVARAESACLFDDDNDLPMAEMCGAHFLPGLTSRSVMRAADMNPSWHVSPRAGQGVFAVEECLTKLLGWARRSNRAAGDDALAQRLRGSLPLRVDGTSSFPGAGGPVGGSSPLPEGYPMGYPEDDDLL